MTTINSYEKLLSNKRERSSDSPGRTLLQESESDRARLIFSSPFRRLQQKAQVYSLEDNAAVRSRLTHSLEVAHIGRFIVQLTLDRLKSSENELGIKGKESFIQNLVETACLMHDVGNPPFGHFGEAAISDWFDRNASTIFATAVSDEDVAVVNLFKKHLQDFILFDGNCQGLRIVARLQWNKDEVGLNLTYSQIATYLKYVVPPSMAESSGKNKLKRKAGFFDVEATLVQKMWTELGMNFNSRFPLTYLMEGADDIAYCISDIEDGIEKNLISEKGFFEWIEKTWIGTYPLGHDNDADLIHAILKKALNEVGEGIPIKAFTAFRASLTTKLANFAADRYVEEHANVLNGVANPLFDGEGPHQDVLDLLKKFAFKHLYSSFAASNNELAGFSVISGILEHYGILLSCDRETFNQIRQGKPKKDKTGRLLVVHQRLYKRLPQKYIRAYEYAVKDLSKSALDSTLEWSHRAHLITDYISGMTDDFALETFQLLSGIKVGKPI